MPRNRAKQKMKLKTHRGAAKRFKITGTGKLLRMHSGKRHLLGTKAPGRMRKLKKMTKVNKADKLKTMQMLAYGLQEARFSFLFRGCDRLVATLAAKVSEAKDLNRCVTSVDDVKGFLAKWLDHFAEKMQDGNVLQKPLW